MAAERELGGQSIVLDAGTMEVVTRGAKKKGGSKARENPRLEVSQEMSTTHPAMLPPPQCSVLGGGSTAGAKRPAAPINLKPGSKVVDSAEGDQNNLGKGLLNYFNSLFQQMMNATACRSKVLHDLCDSFVATPMWSREQQSGIMEREQANSNHCITSCKQKDIQNASNSNRELRTFPSLFSIQMVWMGLQFSSQKASTGQTL